MRNPEVVWERMGNILRYSTDIWYSLLVTLGVVNVMLGTLLHGDVALQILTWSGWTIIVLLVLRASVLFFNKKYEPKAGIGSRAYKLRRWMAGLFLPVMILQVFGNFFVELKLVAEIAAYVYIVAIIAVEAYNIAMNNKKNKLSAA